MVARTESKTTNIDDEQEHLGAFHVFEEVMAHSNVDVSSFN